MQRFFHLRTLAAALGAVALMLPAAALAYGQGGYYSQSGYYSQGYYQGSYTGACGSFTTASAPPKQEVAWGARFLGVAMHVLTGLPEYAFAYNQGTYYSQTSYYAQSYYQGGYGPAGICITKYSYSAGDGGYAPGSNTYWGGGGGGGLIINGSATNGNDGYGSSGNSGKGYGGGGGGSYYAAYGGSGAPGVVYVEWDDAAPSAPTVTGNNTVVQGATRTYTFQSTDPESDSIHYGVDWNSDGTVDQWVPSSGFAGSGVAQSASHTWSTQGTQTFKVEAEDSAYVDSGWTTYTVVVTQPAPVVLLTASPSTVSTGQSSTLTWSSSNATSCTGTNFTTAGATSGTVSVSPTQSTTYTATCTGPGGTGSDSKTVAYSCTPQNVCSNGNVVNSCTGATIQVCSYSCSAGACTAPPPPGFTSFTGTFNGNSFTGTGHLQVKPSLVPVGGQAYVYWNVSNASSCTVTSNNGDSWSGASSGSTGKQSKSITSATIFTLSCTGLDSSTINESQTVNVVPVFQEL